MDYKIKYGDVPTPNILVDQTLDLLPDNVWKNKSLKWLDIGCGNGIFIYSVYKRLLTSLIDQFSNMNECRNHIIRNMLYMIEINSCYIEHLKSIFTNSTNIINEDFLIWNNKLYFDVIIGNPPYNANGLIKVPTNNNLNKKNDGKCIWKQFVKKSIRLLSNNGYLSVIIPVIWMKPDKENIYQLLTGKNILKIKCYNNTEANKLFSYNAQTPICCISIKNSNINNNSQNILIYDNIIKNTFVKYNLKKLLPIPMCCQEIFTIFQTFIEKYGSLKNTVFKTNMPPNNSTLNEIIDEKHIYKNIHSCIIKDKVIPELSIRYSNIPLAFYNQQKIVCAHKMYGFPYYDKKGEYGISNRDNYVFIINNDKNAKMLCDFLSTSIIRTLFKSTQYRMKYLEKYIFELIPNIVNIPDFPETINNQTLYDFFNFEFDLICFEEKIKYKQFNFPEN